MDNGTTKSLFLSLSLSIPLFLSVKWLIKASNVRFKHKTKILIYQTKKFITKSSTF